MPLDSKRTSSKGGGELTISCLRQRVLCAESRERPMFCFLVSCRWRGRGRSVVYEKDVGPFAGQRHHFSLLQADPDTSTRNRQPNVKSEHVVRARRRAIRRYVSLSVLTARQDTLHPSLLTPLLLLYVRVEPLRTRPHARTLSPRRDDLTGVRPVSHATTGPSYRRYTRVLSV